MQTYADGLLLFREKHLTEDMLKAASKSKPEKLIAGSTLKNGAENAAAEAKKCLSHFCEFTDSMGNMPSGKNYEDAFSYVASKYRVDTGGNETEEGGDGEAQDASSDGEEDPEIISD